MAEEKKLTRSDEIWDTIRILPVNIYALPGQTLEQHVTRFKVTDNMVHLKLRSPAIIQAMEEAFQNVKLAKDQRFDVVQAKDFTVISIVSDDGR